MIMVDREVVLVGQKLDSPRRRPAILIVGQDEDQVFVLSRRLENQGFDTIAAYCGERGLAAAKARRPDVVILHEQLPDIEAFELCRQLCADTETAALPLIVLGHLEEPDAIPLARSVGCTYYLRQPCDPHALLTLILHSVERKTSAE